MEKCHLSVGKAADVSRNSKRPQEATKGKIQIRIQSFEKKVNDLMNESIGDILSLPFLESGSSVIVMMNYCNGLVGICCTCAIDF
jgi:hypothetical protein